MKRTIWVASAALTLLANFGMVVGGQPKDNIHPYPLFPFQSVPGRSGMGAPEIKALRAAYDAARDANDEETQAAILGQIRSESFNWGHPQFLPYPGSIEHVRHHSQRYLPPYPKYNQHTLAKNFVLKDHAATRSLCVHVAEPVYWHTQWGLRIATSETRGPLAAYAWKPGQSVDLPIGRLAPRVMYAVRVIGALKTQDVVHKRIVGVEDASGAEKQLVFQFEINDRPDGGTSTYVLRGRANDNFYETVVFFFHGLDDRAYSGKLTLLAESQATLYAYNVDVHNVFGECARRVSQRRPAKAITPPAPTDAAARAQRDQALWNSLPPINVHFDSRIGREVSGGFAFAPYGKEWDRPYRLFKGKQTDPESVYTRDDLAAHKPLPGTDDRGWGVEVTDEKRQLASYIGYANFNRYQAAGRRLRELVVGDASAKRDAAFLLARLAYQYPAVTARNALAYAESGTPEQPPRRYGPGSDIPGGWGSFGPDDLVEYYDQLFDFICANDELAAALGRYIPWIKTPEDVRYLFDVYVVQYAANEMMHFRYYYDHGLAAMVTHTAEVAGDNTISKPWMDFVFTRGWEYPQTLGGVADNIVTNTTREGVTNIGSTFYAQPAGLMAAELTMSYLKKGGLKDYDLSDFRQFPKSEAGRNWEREATVAGGQFLSIGDVGGPSEPYGKRNPTGVRLPSRVLSDWSGILESGIAHDDFRFRRAVAVRVGNGAGHGHKDTLDLRLWALGVTMSGDFGQRPAYGRPRHQRSYLHNVVEVDGDGTPRGDWHGYAWVRNLFDAPGAPYLLAESIAPRNHGDVNLFRRHVALVDVDEGSAAKGKTSADDASVTLPASYVMDVFRVAGGKRHTYCFHGVVDDGFTVNVKNKTLLKEDGESEDAKYLQRFRYERFYRDEVRKLNLENQQAFVPDRDRQWAAEVDGDTLVADWTLCPLAEKKMLGGKGAATPSAKHTRLHLLGQAEARVLHAIAVDKTDAAASNPSRRRTSGRCLFAQRRFTQEAESVFIAFIEPYADRPTITHLRELEVTGNESDARRATAVEVTTKNGHTDICFTDGRAGKTRRLERGVTVNGEFAFVSRDEKGLRQATLTGGTTLSAPGMRLELPTAAYSGKITKVDLLDRYAWVQGLPAEQELEGLFFEIGNDEHRSSFEVDQITTDTNGTRLHIRKGLEIMRAAVIGADYAQGRLTTNLAMLHFPGRDAGLVATNADLTQHWRVAFEGGNRHEGFRFKLSGAPISAKEFPIGGRLSVWELGAGDTVTLKTGVSIRRASAPGEWETYANSPFTIDLSEATLEWSTDRNAWQAVNGAIGPGQGQPRRFYLRKKP